MIQHIAEQKKGAAKSPIVVLGTSTCLANETCIVYHSTAEYRRPRQSKQLHQSVHITVTSEDSKYMWGIHQDKTQHHKLYFVNLE